MYLRFYGGKLNSITPNLIFSSLKKGVTYGKQNQPRMNHTLGIKGEEKAVQFLIRKEYLILERNYRFGRNEIDIIALNNEQIVFVEVKTRNSNVLGEPYAAVTKHKQKQIIKVANHYLVENRICRDARLDVISIVLNKNVEKIEHIEAAFSTI